MSTLFNVQHVIHELLIVPVALCQIDLIGIDDQQRRGIVVKKELAVHLVELLKIPAVNQLAQRRYRADRFVQAIDRGSPAGRSPDLGGRIHLHFGENFFVQRVFVRL